MVATPLHLEAELIWWYDFFNQKMHGLTWLELVELDVPKMKGQCQLSMRKIFFIIYFQQTKYVELCRNTMALC